MPPQSPASSWDAAFGGWRSLVSYVEDQLEAWLDEFDAGLDILSAVVNLLAVNPALDYAGVDALTQFFEGVTDAGSNAIRAGLTNSLRDELACYGLCVMYNANHYTLTREILDAWEQQDHDILNPAKWAILEAAERLPLARKVTYYNLGMNDNDSDWEILCDCLVERDEIAPPGATWRIIKNFQITDGGFSTNWPDRPLRGLYIPGTGWRSVQGPQYTHEQDLYLWGTAWQQQHHILRIATRHILPPAPNWNTRVHAVRTDTDTGSQRYGTEIQENGWHYSHPNRLAYGPALLYKTQQNTGAHVLYLMHIYGSGDAPPEAEILVP